MTKKIGFACKWIDHPGQVDGQIWPGVMWLILGISLVFDAHQFK